jgi:hypothetical protein
VTTLFQRNYNLLIGPKYTGRPNDPNGILIKDLRVQFQIEKSLDKEPNTANIEVTNLSGDSRSLVEGLSVQTKGGTPVFQQPTLFLNCGYGVKDVTLKNIFQGDIARVTHKRIGTDITTMIEAGDGEVAYNGTSLDKSFSPGTKFDVVLGEVARAMGLSLGQVAGIKPDQFLQGLSLSGPARMQLQNLMTRQGLSWSIQNGKLQILPPDTGTAETAILINSQTGLIGSPFKTKVVNQSLLKKKDGKEAESGVNVQSLLNPDITPGRIIKLESQLVSGVFFVKKLKHIGDTHGTNWYTEMECVEKLTNV